MRKVLGYIWRGLRTIVLSLILVVLLLLWGLRTEWFQDWATPQIERILSDQLKTQVTLGGFDLDLPAKIVLRRLVIEDQQGERMFAVGELRVNVLTFSLVDLISSAESPESISIGHLDIVQPEAFIYKSRRDSALNMAFLTESEPDTNSKPLSLSFEAPSIGILSGTFVYRDSTAADSLLQDTLAFNPQNVALTGLTSDLFLNLDLRGHVEGGVSTLQVQETHTGRELTDLVTQFTCEFGDEFPNGPTLDVYPFSLRAEGTEINMAARLSNKASDTLRPDFLPFLEIDFDSSVVDFDLVNAFMAKPLPLTGPVGLRGALVGGLDTLRSEELQIAVADTTRLTTSLLLTHLDSVPDLTLVLDIAPSRVAFSELKQLMPGIELPLAGTLYLEGPYILDLQNMASTGLHVRYGNYTDLLVRSRVYNYQDEKNMLLDFRTRTGKVDFGELRSLLAGIALPDWLPNLGRGSVDGQFIGGTHDFVVKGDLKSSVGDVNGNLHLVTPRGPGTLAYEGRVTTRNLNLDRVGITDDFQSSRLNFSGYVKGSGEELGEMELDVSGRLVNSEIMGYTLDSVGTKDIRLDGWKVKGGVELVDAQGNASVTVDMIVEPKGEHQYNVFGDIGDLDLAHYGLVPDDSVFLSTILNVRLNGDSIENYTGKLRFFQIQLNRPGVDSIRLNNVVLSSAIEGDLQRKLSLNSSLAAMDINGQFRIGEVIDVSSRLAKEIDLYIRNNDSLIEQYYDEKEIVPADISLHDTITTKRGLNDMLEFFRVPAYIEPGTQASVTLIHDGTDQLFLDVQSDTVRYANVLFADNEVDFILEKREDENELLLVGRAGSGLLQIGNNLRILDFAVDPEGNDRQLDLFVKGQQPDLGNRYVLDIRTEFFADGEIRTQILPGPSRINIKGDIWRFGEGNMIKRVYQKPESLGEDAPHLIERFLVKDFKFFRGDRILAINGAVSDDPSDQLEAKIRNFPIGEILEITEQDLGIDGLVTKADVNASFLLTETPNIFAVAEIDNFRYQTVDSLDISTTLGWPYVKGPDYAGISAVIDKEGIGNLDLYGNYRFSNSALDFEARPSSIPLSWVEPFLEGEVTNLQGRVSLDSLFIKGTTSQPQIDGTLHLNDVGARVTYLNNSFALGDNSLVFKNDALTIPRLKISDSFGGSAVIRGKVFYPSLSNVRLDLLLDQIKDFTIMDTRRRHSADFYGHVVLRGDSAQIRGTANNLQLGAKVSTADNTWLDIPLDDYTNANGLDYVTFVAGGTELEVKEEEADLSGIAMKVTVNATPGARIRMILDEQVGDIIEARGEGAITMEITENGEFSMSGVYELTEGNYLFTAENIVNKKFVVQPGGRIIFNGDPYNAELDLTAVYKVNADISDLLGDQSGRVPVNILMNMTGSLEEPVIRLSLQVDELRQQDVLGLASYFRRIEYDEQELNKQVVSLLLFGRFSGNTGGNAGSTATGVTSSISELISNQVNYWISQAFEDANLNFEVNTNEFQDVELAIRTTLFQDRVTIERNGAIISNQNRSVSIGDLSVQIKLLPLQDSTRSVSPDAGQLVLEIFNREDASLNAGANVTRGAGVFYKKDFDRIPDLFRRARPKKSDPTEEDE